MLLCIGLYVIIKYMSLSADSAVEVFCPVFCTNLALKRNKLKYPNYASVFYKMYSNELVRVPFHRATFHRASSRLRVLHRNLPYPCSGQLITVNSELLSRPNYHSGTIQF